VSFIKASPFVSLKFEFNNYGPGPHRQNIRGIPFGWQSHFVSTVKLFFIRISNYLYCRKEYKN